MTYKEKFSLDNKVALVTGGAGYLGAEFCHGLAEFGANIVIVDIDQEKIDALKIRLMEEYSIKAYGLTCDVSDKNSIINLMKQIEDKNLVIDILVNNAASKSSDLNRFFDSFEDYTLETWREVMDTNIDGMFLMAQAIGKHMIKNTISGSIIQTSSIYGHIAPCQEIYEGSYYLEREINTPAVYSASKAAVIGLSKYLSAYWADKNIRVNTLTPGGIESGQNDVFNQKYSSRVPMKRMGEKEELVGAVVFLASNASSYITGQNYIVDGGLSVW